MTAIFAIADVHAGNHGQHGGTLDAGVNERCREIVAVLTDVCDRVEREGGVLLVCGDLIDKVTPPAQVLGAVQVALSQVPAIILKGNHETNSDALGDNALAPLRPIATVVETPTVFDLDGVSLWCVPFKREPAVEWLADALTECATQAGDDGAERVLAVHLGIADGRTAKFLTGSPDSIEAKAISRLCAQHGIQHVYAGNWHDQRTWRMQGVHIHQLGALVPTGWNNPGLDGYGGLGIYRAGKVPELLQLPGPRFVKAMTDSDIEDACALPDEVRSRVYLRAYVDPEQVSTTSDRLGALGFRVVEVHAHAVYRTVAAKAAASSAAAADNVTESIERYVMKAPLPSGVTPDDETAYRQGVLQLTKDLLVEALTHE